MPRIRNLRDLTFYRADTETPCQRLGAKAGDTFNDHI